MITTYGRCFWPQHSSALCLGVGVSEVNLARDEGAMGLANGAQRYCRECAKMVYRCFLEARPAVQGIFLLRFLVGAHFADPLLGRGTDFLLWGCAVLWGCVILSVYILNGVMDVEEDRVNASKRPIAQGDLSVNHAAAAVAVLAILSVVGSLMLERSMFWNMVAVLILGWVYSGPPLYLKRWPAGLAAVAIFAGLLTYHAGYVVNDGDGDSLQLLVFAAVMSLWMGLVGQTKDLSDVEGDEHAGRRSGPVSWGEDAARLVYSVMAISLGASYVLWAALSGGNYMVPALVLACGALLVAAILLGPWSKGCRSARRRPYRAFMSAQYGAHLAIILW